MRVHHKMHEWRTMRTSDAFAGCRVGFVPTMGALHEGHHQLLKRARTENDRVVLSIFVNPPQFNDPNDLTKYPRTLEADLALSAGLVDDVIVPEAVEIYPDKYRYRMTENQLSTVLEGAHRPGHFDGVLTVVLKLLNLVQPHRAYFGEKDWQQLHLVDGMVKALLLPLEIVHCETVRDPDGLAMSSRNRRLSAAARARAAEFPRILRAAATTDEAARALVSAGFEVDYVEERDGVRLGAVRIEDVRLIDNVRR